VFLILPLLAVFALYYSSFWSWSEIAGVILGRTEMFRMSLASVTKELLQTVLPAEVAQPIAAGVFLTSFLLIYILILLRYAAAKGFFSVISPAPAASSRRRWQREIAKLKRWLLSAGEYPRMASLMFTGTVIFLLYLLLASLWFWPWYLIWPIALLPLAGDAWLVTVLTVIGCAGQLIHILWNFPWYWMGIEWETLYQIERWSVLLLILPALLITIIYKRQGRTGNLQGQSSAIF
jgi:hypothetical protein